MSLYDWKESYSVEIESIDNDHKGLLKIINQLFDAISHGRSKENLSEYLLQLLAYTKMHFKREEMYFSTTNYPEYVEHRLQHEFFIEKIEDLKRQFESGEQQISVKLMSFLSDWLINHIIISDKRYMTHLKNYGLS